MMVNNNSYHYPSFLSPICLQLTLYNAETNSRVDYDVYRTVTSHTFYDLSPDTAYTVTITAVNEAGDGPAVSAKAITQAVPGRYTYSYVTREFVLYPACCHACLYLKCMHMYTCGWDSRQCPT